MATDSVSTLASLASMLVSITTRAANEGVPVAAIARITGRPFDLVSKDLKGLLSCGKIGVMPAADWPPTAKWADRLPSGLRTPHPEDVEFQCKRLFKLTNLEVAFMMVLLRHDNVNKDKLHAVVEEQRVTRAFRPDKSEATDPKMVDVIVCKIRKKLKAVDEAFVLTTSWGSGYFFDASVKRAIFQRIADQDGAQGEVQGGETKDASEPSAQRASDPQHPA